MTFDRVHKGDASQINLYDCCSDMVEAALQGYNACIMTYGQTGAWPPQRLASESCAATCCSDIDVPEQKRDTTTLSELDICTFVQDLARRIRL